MSFGFPFTGIAAWSAKALRWALNAIRQHKPNIPKSQSKPWDLCLHLLEVRLPSITSAQRELSDGLSPYRKCDQATVVIRNKYRQPQTSRPLVLAVRLIWCWLLPMKPSLGKASHPIACLPSVTAKCSGATLDNQSPFLNRNRELMWHKSGANRLQAASKWPGPVLLSWQHLATDESALWPLNDRPADLSFPNPHVTISQS